tara:strand:- start:697 stop:813 length:117 start_codon:yes stop_codon:yes gene_type:complete
MKPRVRIARVLAPIHFKVIKVEMLKPPTIIELETRLIK